MEATTEFKKRVIKAILEDAPNYPSAAKQAVSLGINAAQLSRLKKGELERVISEPKWVSLGRKLEVSLNPSIKWKTARTPVFEFIYNQLTSCQEYSISGVMCDNTDIGKTHTAKAYVRSNKNAVYVDCSQVKSKQLFVRKIAREFGVDHTGRYVDVYEDLTFYLKSLDRPLIILDEAGDLRPDAFIEIKALWNATERSCGWYMMGADGLKAKLEKHRDLKKVGFAEIIRRFGSRFQKVSPDGKEELKQFQFEQFAAVAKVNGLTKIQELYRKSNGSLERARIEYEKTQRQAGQLTIQKKSA